MLYISSKDQVQGLGMESLVEKKSFCKQKKNSVALSTSMKVGDMKIGVG